MKQFTAICLLILTVMAKVSDIACVDVSISQAATTETGNSANVTNYRPLDASSLVNHPQEVKTLTSLSTFLSVLLLALFAAVGSVQIPIRRRSTVPGPLGLPLFGNILEFRKGHVQSLASWGRKYGGIFSIVLGRREVVILNNYRAVTKTLMQEGASFQSRPEFALWHGSYRHAVATTTTTTLGTSRYDKDTGYWRKIVAERFNSRSLTLYEPLAARRLYEMVSQLADFESKGKAQDLGECFWTTTNGISADELFGTHIDYERVRVLSELAIDAFRLRSLGQPLYNYVPELGLLRSLSLKVSNVLPSFMNPLSIEDLRSVDDHAEEVRTAEVKYGTQLIAELKDRLEAGDSTPSVLGDILRSLPQPLSANDEYRLVTSLIITGMSVGTTLTFLFSFLASHPEIQEAAHAAIEEVYGGVPPDPLDTDRVEYIKALGLEAGRYFAVARTGFFRETMNDAEFDFDGQAMRVPKGTVVVYNSYTINRDEERYDRAEEFLPERWLDGRYGRTDKKTPKVGVPHMNHGAGRRACLGVANANKSFYGAISLLVHFFTFERGELDESAKDRVFPALRVSAGQASSAMHPLDDQISQCDYQALPKYAGIHLKARNRHALDMWLKEQRDFENWD